MRQGIDIGVRTGILSGVSARWVPQTAEEFTAALPAVTAPSGLWLFDEATGDFADRIGSNDFSVSAGTVTRGVVGERGRKCIELASADAALEVVSTTFMDGGTDTNLSWFVRCFHASPSSNKGLLSKRAGSPFTGWQFLLRGTNGVQVVVDGGTPGDIATASGDHRGLWHSVVASFDWAAALSIDTDLGSGEDATISVADITTSVPMTLGAETNITTEAGVRVSYVAVWDGYALTATERKILRDFFA
jgi:hypothetical protein